MTVWSIWWTLLGCGFPTCGTAEVANTGLSFVNPNGRFAIDETYDLYCGKPNLPIGGSLTYRPADAGVPEQVVFNLGPHEHPENELIVDALLSHDFRIPPDSLVVGTRWDLTEIGASVGITGITGSGVFEDADGNTSTELFVSIPAESGWIELTALETKGDCDTGDGSLSDTEVTFSARVDMETTHTLDGATVTTFASDIWLTQSGFLNTDPALGVSPVGRICGRFGTL